MGAQHTQYKILELQFANFGPFRENNCIDFRKNVNNDIIEIIANNEYGKTTIVLALLFCLYGEKVDACIGSIKKIFNRKGKKFDCSLSASVGENMYFIKRTGTVEYSNVSVMFYSIINNDKTNITGIDNHETDTRIERIFGSFNDFLMCSSYLYNEFSGISTSFMKLTPHQRFNYLAKMEKPLGLPEYIPKIEKYVNNIVRKQFAHKIKIELVKDKINIYVINDYERDIKTLSNTESMLLDLSIKYAFAKALPCIKPNIFIMDFTYNSPSMCKGNIIFKDVIKYMNDNEVNVMLLGIDKKLKNDNNFVLNINRNHNNESHINNSDE